MPCPFRVAVLPEGSRPFLRRAVVDGGGVVVDGWSADSDVDVDGLIWAEPRAPDALATILAAHPALPWVQLPWAGVEHYRHVLDNKRLWTAGQGIYADDVAEHALALMLAVLRALPRRARATSWGPPVGRSLRGARVTILGGGGIATSLMPLLAPFAPIVTVVRRQWTRPFPGAERVLPPTRLDEALTNADVVVVALALTPSTTGILNTKTLALLPAHAVVVNVGRGGHIVTDDLVDALQRGQLGGAGLDVTDPEPLPDGHPLFQLDTAIITPHCANTPEMAEPVLTARVRENVRRRIAGEALLGVIDVDAGY